jgi:uptake hydrogenase large subunit
MSRITLDIDLNRVEGDLEFQLDLEDGIVTDARCIGTLYRGFEQLLIGRAPRDALVITPRVCGICGTAHLYAATRALEQLAGITPPAHAVHVRNLCLLAETLQSDLRQSFLFFTPDFCDAAYAEHPLAGELQQAFAPLKGDVVRGCLRATRDVVGIVALFGGQWPHSTYMLPGGISQPANASAACSTPGTSWRAPASGSRMPCSAARSPNGWPSTVPPRYSAGRTPHRPASARRSACSTASPATSACTGSAAARRICSASASTRCPARPAASGRPASSTATAAEIEALDQLLINEHVRHSWFLDYPGGRHPWQGETIPEHLPDSDRYTWAKAPRYGDRVMQTGPLAQLRIAGDPLIADLLASEGDNTWLRQFARLRRAARLLALADETLAALRAVIDTPHFVDPGIDTWPDGDSFGLVEAARGALGHWLRVRDGVIDKYQIVTPTAWNASPRDSQGRHGHWEQSVIGLRVADPDQPLEIGHIVRSHDPCLVCTVHCLGSPRKLHIDV